MGSKCMMCGKGKDDPDVVASLTSRECAAEIERAILHHSAIFTYSRIDAAHAILRARAGMTEADDEG